MSSYSSNYSDPAKRKRSIDIQKTFGISYGMADTLVALVELKKQGKQWVSLKELILEMFPEDFAGREEPKPSQGYYQRAGRATNSLADRGLIRIRWKKPSNVYGKSKGKEVCLMEGRRWELF